MILQYIVWGGMLMSQKELEQRCFDDMLTFGMMGTSKRTKQIIKKFTGEVVIRSQDESPDILIKNGSRNGVNRYIGVEHFEVDHKSFRKKGTPQSGYKRLKSKIVNMVDPQISELTDSQISDIVSAVEYGAGLSINKNYISLIESFHYGLDKHYGKLDGYRKNILNETSVGVEVELAFLIEMYVDFDNMVLFDGFNLKANNMVMPMLKEMVDKLSRLDKRKLDYVILVIRSTCNDKINVIPLSLRYFDQDFEKQGIKVYDYLGFDLFEEAFSKRSNVKGDYHWVQSSGVIDLNFMIDTQQKAQIFNILLLILTIQESIVNKKPFMTNQTILNIYDDIIRSNLWRNTIK